jgi:hypothetical protein
MKKTYTKEVNIDKLTKEIRAANIVTALDYVNTLGTITDIYFKAITTESDVVILDQIILDHVATPLPSESETVLISSQPAFAAKTIEINGVVKKLYKRVHGIESSLQIGENTIIFTIPYTWAKITGAALISGEFRDKANFYILDSTAGNYSGVPNYVLNQFGFNVNIAKDQHKYESQYDADLYQGMQIKIVYNSISAKTIGINILLDEVKS